MKPEIKQLIIKELSDLKDRKVSKIADNKLAHLEKRRTPYEKVLEMYNLFKQTGNFRITSKKYGMTDVNLKKLLNMYNFPWKEYAFDPRITTLCVRADENEEFIATQKSLDTLTLGKMEWVRKYNAHEKGYYTRKRYLLDNPQLIPEGIKIIPLKTIKQKFVPTERHTDSLVLTISDWNKKYGTKSRSRYYKAREQMKRVQNVDNL